MNNTRQIIIITILVFVVSYLVNKKIKLVSLEKIQRLLSKIKLPKVKLKKPDVAKVSLKTPRVSLKLGKVGGLIKSKMFRIIVILTVLIVGGIYFVPRITFKKNCDPLSPLTLEKYQIAGGVLPILGERCTVEKKILLNRVIYKTKEDAEKAYRNLLGSVQGEKSEVDGTFWVRAEEDSVIFLHEDTKVGVAVLIGVDKESAVQRKLKMILDKHWGSYSTALVPEEKATTAIPLGEKSCRKITGLQSGGYLYTLKGYECKTPTGLVSYVDGTFTTKCLGGGEIIFSDHHVLELDVAGSEKITLDAKIGLTSFASKNASCDSKDGHYSGINRTGAIMLGLFARDPQEYLKADCQGPAESTDEWNEHCRISDNEFGMIDYCTVPECGREKECSFETNTFGVDKLYLVYLYNDAVTDVNFTGSFDGGEICKY